MSNPTPSTEAITSASLSGAMKNYSFKVKATKNTREKGLSWKRRRHD
jgi:hypothetical protein